MHDQTTLERFWSKADRSAGPEACWPWTASITKKGYGRFGFNGSTHAHRVAYIFTHGPIPDGLVVDHICFNRRCVNPAHLQLLTAVENTKRRDRGDHCLRGHRMERGQAHCGQCGNISFRRQRADMRWQDKAELRERQEAVRRWRAGEAPMPEWVGPILEDIRTHLTNR